MVIEGADNGTGEVDDANTLDVNAATLLEEALKTLNDVQPIINEFELKKAKKRLDTQLYTRFNLGQRKKDSREIESCMASSRLYSGLNKLNIPLPHQARIINELATASEGVYTRATHDYNVPDNAMQLAAKMWVYSTLTFAAIDKFRGRLK